MSRYRKEQKFVRRIAKKIRKSLTAFVGQPLVVEDVKATLKSVLYADNMPGRHPNCNYLAETACNKCGWVKGS